MTRPPRDALRQEILDVAQRLFAGIGFRATSLQMIADEAGCSKASLLYHFHTKAALLTALVDDLLDDVEQRREAIEDRRPDADRAGAVRLGIALVVRHRRAIAMLRGLDDLPELAPLVQRGDAFAARARELLLGDRPATYDVVAAQVFEHGVLGACLESTDLSDAELTAALTEVAARLLPDHRRPDPGDR